MPCINQKYYAADPDDGRFDFPEDIFRVTGGAGGESYLILGSEKTALYDAGMPFNGEQLVRNIQAVLGDRLFVGQLSGAAFAPVSATVPWKISISAPWPRRVWIHLPMIDILYINRL